jgi:hypothetical protein
MPLSCAGTALRLVSRHLDFVLPPACLREIVGCLQTNPEISRRTKRLLQPDCNLGRDTAAFVDQVVERLTGNPEHPCTVGDRQTQRGKTFLADQFTGMGRFFIGIAIAPQWSSTRATSNSSPFSNLVTIRQLPAPARCPDPLASIIWPLRLWRAKRRRFLQTSVTHAGDCFAALAMTPTRYSAATTTGWRAMRSTSSDASKHAAPLARNAMR